MFSLAQDPNFIKALETVLEKDRLFWMHNTDFDGHRPALYFEALTRLDERDQRNPHEVALTAARFFDNHGDDMRYATANFTRPALKRGYNPPVDDYDDTPDYSEPEDLLKHFNPMELKALADTEKTFRTNTAKPRWERKNRRLQALGAAVLGVGSGIGLYTQLHARDVQAPPAAVSKEGAAGQTTAKPDSTPEDNVVPYVEKLTPCPGPYALGGVGLFSALCLLVLASEIGKEIKHAEKASQTDYEGILERIFEQIRNSPLEPLQPDRGGSQLG